MNVDIKKYYPKSWKIVKEYIKDVHPPSFPDFEDLTISWQAQILLNFFDSEGIIINIIATPNHGFRYEMYKLKLARMAKYKWLQKLDDCGIGGNRDNATEYAIFQGFKYLEKQLSKRTKK